MAVGQSVQVNAFSNYDTLKKLVKKFNARVSKSNRELCLDESIVHLRDILVHGRVYGLQPSPPLHLVKFAKPTANRAVVTHSEILDEHWLKSKTNHVRLELEKVYEAGKLLRPGSWPAA